MKKFICKGLIAISILLGFLAYLEISFRNIPSKVDYKYHFIEQHAQDIEILCVGSSMEQNGIRPDLFHRPAFNAAAASQPPEIDHAIITHFWDKFDSLKVLILPLSYFSLFHKEHFDGVPYYYYIHFTDLNLSNTEIYDRLSITSFKFKNVYQSVTSKSRPRTFGDLNIDSLGWEYIASSFNKFSPRDKDHNAVSFAADLSNKCCTDTTLNAARYREIISLCHQRGIHVILLSVPKTTHFYKFASEQQVDIVQQQGIMFQEQYPNVTYVDLFHDIRFTDDDYYNANHLNTRGAEKLTLILDSIIEDILLT